MTYLDDASRARIRADVSAFVTGEVLGQLPSAVAAAVPPVATKASQEAGRTASLPRTGPMPVGTADRDDRRAQAQGGDPWVPPALRVAPAAPSPSGAALDRLVRQKLAERNRDVYR